MPWINWNPMIFLRYCGIIVYRTYEERREGEAQGMVKYIMSTDQSGNPNSPFAFDVRKLENPYGLDVVKKDRDIVACAIEKGQIKFPEGLGKKDEELFPADILHQNRILALIGQEPKNSARKISARPISVDVETSGIDPKINALLSIGAVTGEAGKEGYREFYVEICPPEGLKIEEKAMKVNGLDLEQLKANGKPEKEALVSFLEWVKQSQDWTALGQNPAFDLGFIREACYRNGLKCPFPARSIDLHSVAVSVMAARGGYPLKQSYHDPAGFHTSTELDDILSYVGLKRRAGAHNALDDAKLELEAWQRLVRYMYRLMHPETAGKVKITADLANSPLHKQ